MTRFGAVGVDGTWSEPRWELPALIATRARRSAASVSASLRSLGAAGRFLQGDLKAFVAGHYESWSGVGGTVKDALLTSSIVWTSWRGRPRVWAQYGVTILRVLSEGRTTSASNGVALPDVLANSHVHSGTVGLRFPIWRQLVADGFGGYSLALQGSSAAQFGGSLAWIAPTGLSASLAYAQSVTPGSYGATIDRVTAQVTGRL